MSCVKSFKQFLSYDACQERDQFFFNHFKETRKILVAPKVNILSNSQGEFLAMTAKIKLNILDKTSEDFSAQFSVFVLIPNQMFFAH